MHCIGSIGFPIIIEHFFSLSYQTSYNRSKSLLRQKTSDWFVCLECEYLVFPVSGSSLEEHMESHKHFDIISSEAFSQKIGLKLEMFQIL